MIGYYQTYLDTKGQVGKWVQNKTKLTRLNENKTVDELEVGDSITNYQSNKNNTIEWKVLGVENGNVLLMSSTNVATKILAGKEGYINGITELNNLCEGYDDGIGAIKGSARSIKVEDVNKVTGYNPMKQKEELYRESIGEVTRYSNKVTYTLNENGKIYFSSLLQSGESPYDNQNFENVDGKILVKESEYNPENSNTIKSVTIENGWYGYYPTSLTKDKNNTQINGISKDSEAYKLLFENTNEGENPYWLASSYTEGYNGYIQFGIRRVAKENVGVTCLYRTIIESFEGEVGVRAVVTLNSNIQFTKVGEHTHTISFSNE